MKRSKKIWFNGKLIDWNKAKVHVLTHALHYGSGVFEGIRCYNTGDGPAIFRLDDHIKRLVYSSECLGIKIPFKADKIKKSIISLVKINKIREAYIRPIAFCGYGKVGPDIGGSPVNTAIILWPWKGMFDGNKGITTHIASYRRISHRSIPIDAKMSGYYINSIITTAEARKKGADEAILLDHNGYVAEGPGENIFIVKSGIVYTPSKGAILPGITRDTIIRMSKDGGVKVVEKKMTVRDLKNADEVFFTGTAVEVCPIIKISGQRIGAGKIGPVALDTMKKYRDVVRGGNSKYKKWLTYV